MKKFSNWWSRYIGSHTVVELIDNDYDVTIVDNLANSDISLSLVKSKKYLNAHSSSRLIFAVIMILKMMV